jgi:hypothetical protein
MNAQTHEWISVKDRLPEIKDDSVLAYWSENGGMDMVHIKDYFGNIGDGVIDGVQQYTQLYISQGITHWMPMPEAPKEIK